MSETQPARGSATARGSAHVFGLAVVQYLLAFVASAIVARALGPDGRGAYYLPVLAATTAVALGKLGIDQANIFLYGTSGIALPRLAAQNGLVAVVCGGILAAGLGALPRALPAVFGGTSVRLLWLAGITIPFSIHAQLTGSLLAMSGRVRRQYVAGVIAALVQVCLATGLVLSSALTVAAALLLAVVASIVTWAVIAAPLRTVPGSWIGFDTGLLRTTLRSALVLHLGMLLFFLHLRIDMYMVKGWLGTAALGQYSIAVTLAETLMLATDAVAVAVLPSQMGNTIKEAAERALRAARINGVLAFALAGVAALVSGPAIRLLFGSAYEPAVLPMIVLLPGIITLGMQRVCGAPALRAGRPGYIAAIYGATLTSNVVLNVFWIPRFGLVGASLASTVSYLAGSLLFLGWTSRLAHMSFAQALRFDASDASAVSEAARTFTAMARALLASPRDPL